MGKRDRVFNKTGGRCFYCGCNLDKDNFHLDHVVPKSKGGKTDCNIVPACPDCNISKGDLSVDEFREKIGGMLTERHIGRMIDKYYQPRRRDIKFYFEREENNGHLQKRIYDILDGQQGV